MGLISIGEFPEKLERFFIYKGYRELNLYDYQREAFSKLYEGKDLLVVVPPGRGKTIVAKFLITLSLWRKKIACYLVPTVELLKEKARQIQEFFGDGAHVIVLAGEYKPYVSEIRRNEKRLVIVGTYEAFTSFLFNIKKYEYFRSAVPFGCVIVDEAHYLGDVDRRPNLEFLIWKVRNEFGSQILLLSASFSERSARRWSERFGLELIYENEYEPIKYKIKTYDKLKDKYKVVLGEVDLIISEFKNLGDNKRLLILIFCYTRLEAESLAIEIRNLVLENFKFQGRLKFYCDFVHAGKNFREREDTVKEFKLADIGILCCSPVLEAGVDIRDIKNVLIIDADRYDGIRLTQIAGRCRDRDGTIIHIVEEGREDILIKKMKVIKLEDNAGVFNGYYMEEIGSWVLVYNFPRLVLQQLYHKQLTFKEIVNQISELGNFQFRERKSKEFLIVENKVGISIDLLKDYIRYILEKSIEIGFILRSGGRYKLTNAGEAFVESLVPFGWGSEIIKYFKENRTPSGKEFKQLHERLVLKQLVEVEKIKDIKRLGNIIEFIRKYDSKNIEKWKLNSQGIPRIEKGFADLYRRTALWIAHSIYNIYLSLIHI